MKTHGPAKINALMASTVITLLLSTPLVWAAGNGNREAPKAVDKVQQASTPTVSSIHVVPADHLVGRELVDAQGIDAGKIDSLVIDIQNGLVEFVMIAPPSTFNAGDELIAVPWQALRKVSAGSGAIATAFNVDKLAKAQRIEPRLLAELHQPQQRGHIYGYFGYSYPPVAAYHGYGYHNDSGPIGNAYAPSPLSSEANPSETAGGGVLVAREGVVATLASETTTSADALRDAEVYAPSGKEIGDIDEVMIDVDRGKVAYVLMSQGGFLGIDKTWFALPVEKLIQSPYSTGYRLTVDDAILKGQPALHADRDNLPARVSATQLATLYQHFGLQPYWESVDHPAAANTTGSAPLLKENLGEGSTR